MVYRMLKDIEASLRTLAADPVVREFVTSTYVKDADTHFVFASNRIEHVGTQTPGGTIAVLNGDTAAVTPTAVTETVQTKAALDFIKRLWAETADAAMDARERCLLTEQNLLESHRILMTGLIPYAGRYRDSEAMTHTSRGMFYYVPANRVQQELQTLVDAFNDRIMASSLSVSDLFSMSASFLNAFLAIHPFADGNGRVGRLWVSYILFRCFPFVFSIPFGLRDAYIGSLEMRSDAMVMDVLLDSARLHLQSITAAVEGRR